MNAKKTKWVNTASPACDGGKIEIKDGIYFVSVDSTLQMIKTPIEAGATRSLDFTAYIPWMAQSFSVSSEIARHFKLMGMICARMEFMPDQGIPCTLFSDALCVECRKAHVYEHLTDAWPVVYPGTHLRMIVQNISDVAATFRGTFEAVSPVHLPNL